MGTGQQTGVLERGAGLGALLALAVLVAVLMAPTVLKQVRALEARPSAPQGPAAVAAYEPR